MAFKKKSPRTLPHHRVSPSSLTSPITIELMTIDTPFGRCYFKRLRYKGCPPIASGVSKLRSGNFKHPDQLIDMHRDNTIRELYGVFSEWPANTTTYNRFRCLCIYVATLDAVDRPLSFSSENVIWYSKELQRLQKLSKSQGGIANSTAFQRKAILGTILKAIGQPQRAAQLPSFSTNKHKPHPTLDDDSFADVGKFMIRGYEKYIKFLQAGIVPTMCPLFDRERLVEQGLSECEIGIVSSASVRRVAPGNGDWRNQLVRLALLLTSMFTGMNTTPLYGLRRRDVLFKKGAGNNYELESVKNRAGGQRQTNALGFTKFSKEFLEKWLLATEHWASTPDTLVFPRFTKSGDQVAWGRNGVSPQTLINKVFTQHCMPKVTASIFRKTRSAQLMRVINDIHEVAEANNNSVETTARDYLYGVQEQHDQANASAFEAQAKLAKGMEKQLVLNEAIWKCKDPLTELEYLQFEHKRPNKTRTGLGCVQPLVDKVAKQRTKYRHINPELDTCIDFLDCFDCPSHALVAEVDDIWMMLSFRDTLREVQTRPAYNSTPSEKFTATGHKTEVILSKLRAKAPDSFRNAEIMNREAPHPLYDDDEAIDDLLRIYG